MKENAGHEELWEEILRNYYSDGINWSYFLTYLFSRDSEKHSLFLLFSSADHIVCTRDLEGCQAGTFEGSSVSYHPMGKGFDYIVWNKVKKKRSSWDNQGTQISFHFKFFQKGGFHFQPCWGIQDSPRLAVNADVSTWSHRGCSIGCIFFVWNLFCAWFLILSHNIQWKKLRAEPKAIMKHL